MSEPAETDSVAVPLTQALEERYLAYALSTITARSVPDVRDGLKPVQRRLVYAMRQLRLDPKSGFKKCARIVGDVIGKYHPHGDQAVYEALVRLSQSFAMRYGLIEGQGNFGSIDGDNAAAMRYTEARLTAVTEALLDGIDEDAVDFRETYDGGEREPLVLPASFPNLLANGATGIAVGMATSIPPHNAAEVCDALLHLIKYPGATVRKLVALMPGPDLPTGGVLAEDTETIVAAYAAGRGSFRVRARWHVERFGRGQYRIVVTEIPFQVQKSRLVEKIADLVAARRLGLVAEVRDESSEDVRLVLEPRSRTVEPEMLMETVFRQTDLEVRIGLNMNVLDGGKTPAVLNLRQVLQAFLDHRHEVLVRRKRHRLGEIEHRLEIVAGYLVVFANLERVIEIVREEDEPKAALMRAFKLSEVQAEAVLNMRLRSLRRFEEGALEREHAALSAERTDLKGLLKKQVAGAGKRSAPRSRASAPALAVKPPKDAVAPRFGRARRRFRSRSRPRWNASPSPSCARPRVGFARSRVTTTTPPPSNTRKVTAAASGCAPRPPIGLGCSRPTDGFYTIACDAISRGRGHGEPVRLMIELGNDEDIVEAFVHRAGEKRLVAASDGRGFLVAAEGTPARTRAGRQVLNVKSPAEACVCVPADGDAVAVVGGKSSPADLPTRRGTDACPRARRHIATPSRRRPQRCDGVYVRRRPELAGIGSNANRNGARPMARPEGPNGARGAARFPALKPVRRPLSVPAPSPARSTPAAGTWPCSPSSGYPRSSTRDRRNPRRAPGHAGYAKG